MFNLIKRLTEKEKEKLERDFTDGETVDALSLRFGCTKLTVIRNLKKSLGEKVYFDFASRSKLSKKELRNQEIHVNTDLNKEGGNKSEELQNDVISFPESIHKSEEFIHDSPFLEIVPLNLDIENSPRKELSSVHISQIELPKVVYIIVDKH